MEHIKIEKENFTFDADVKVKLYKITDDYCCFIEKEFIKEMSFTEFYEFFSEDNKEQYSIELMFPITKKISKFFKNWRNMISECGMPKSEVAQHIIIEDRNYMVVSEISNCYPNAIEKRYAVIGCEDFNIYVRKHPKRKIKANSIIEDAVKAKEDAIKAKKLKEINKVKERLINDVNYIGKKNLKESLNVLNKREYEINKG